MSKAAAVMNVIGLNYDKCFLFFVFFWGGGGGGGGGGAGTTGRSLYRLLTMADAGGIRTYVHPHASHPLYHCATDAKKCLPGLA